MTYIRYLVHLLCKHRAYHLFPVVVEVVGVIHQVKGSDFRYDVFFAEPLNAAILLKMLASSM